MGLAYFQWEWKICAVALENSLAVPQKERNIFDTTLMWKSDIWQLQLSGRQPETKKGASEHIKNNC